MRGGCLRPAGERNSGGNTSRRQTAQQSGQFSCRTVAEIGRANVWHVAVSYALRLPNLREETGSAAAAP
jgi:hypothetical protein